MLFQPWVPGQTTLLPASPSDLLAIGHQMYFRLDLVDELDLSAIVIPAQSKNRRRERGLTADVDAVLLAAIDFIAALGLLRRHRLLA